MIKLDPYSRFEDERGKFTGITRQEWAEVNVIDTLAGHLRGNHYHRDTKELFFILEGEIEVEVRDVRTGRGETFSAMPGDIFIVEPFENHTFRARTDARWLNMLSKPHDESFPDFYREEEGSLK